jgi:hypothetical protein
VQAAGIYLAWGVVPAFMLVFFTLGVWLRRRSPLWLPTAAAVAVTVLLAYSVATILLDGELWAYTAVHLVWCLAALACLVPATFAVAREWAARGVLVVAGLAVPAPLMAWLLAVTIATLAAR